MGAEQDRQILTVRHQRRAQCALRETTLSAIKWPVRPVLRVDTMEILMQALSVTHALLVSPALQLEHRKNPRVQAASREHTVKHLGAQSVTLAVKENTPQQLVPQISLRVKTVVLANTVHRSARPQKLLVFSVKRAVMRKAEAWTSA